MSQNDNLRLKVGPDTHGSFGNFLAEDKNYTISDQQKLLMDCVKQFDVFADGSLGEDEKPPATYL